jgi:hypothetical protein
MNVSDAYLIIFVKPEFATQIPIGPAILPSVRGQCFVFCFFSADDVLFDPTGV